MISINGKKVTSDIINKFGINRENKLGLEGVDGIRGLGVLLVFFFHAYVLSGSPDLSKYVGILSQLVIQGAYAVDLFFVLSGFLLFLPWANAGNIGNNKPSLLHYYRKRVLRIIPAYYFNLTIIFFIIVPMLFGFNYLITKDGLIQVITHFSFAHYLFPKTSSSLGINGSLWTLSIQFQFYLIFPFIAKLFTEKRYLVSLPLFLVISSIWRYISLNGLLELTSIAMASVSQWNVDEATIRFFLSNQLPAQLGHFALGITFANIFIKMKLSSTADKHKKLISGIAPIGLILVLYLFTKANLSIAPWWYMWRITIAFGCVCLMHIVLMNGPKGFGGFFYNKWLRIMGILSYGVYLWHVPIMILLNKLFFIDKMTKNQNFLLLSIVGGVISIMMSCFSYFYIENNYKRKNFKISRPSTSKNVSAK